MAQHEDNLRGVTFMCFGCIVHNFGFRGGAVVVMQHRIQENHPKTNISCNVPG